MSTLEEINLRDIERQLYHDRAPQRGVASLRASLTDGVAFQLLRSHQDQDVRDSREIAARDDIDAFLWYCSIVETACIAGFAPPTPNLPGVRELLHESVVRRYYEKHYPLLLPQLLRSRLDGAWSHVESETTQATAVFVSFLDLSEQLERSEDVRVFRMMLDDFVFGGVRDEHLRAAASDVVQLLRHATQPPEESTALHKACRGFLLFLNFSSELSALLTAAERLPTLRSGMWHLHGYWFTELKRDLGDVIESFSRGAKNTVLGRPLKETDQAALEEHLEQLAQTQQQLCDSSIGRTLDLKWKAFRGGGNQTRSG